MVKHDLLARGIASVVGAIVNGLQTTVNNLAITVANHAKRSTTEEVIIGTYDGKPLYRSCLSIASLPNAATTNYPHGIANVGKIFIGNNSHATDGTNYVPIPFVETNAPSNISIYSTTTNVVIRTGINKALLSGVVFLEYTKTTD